MSTNCVVTGASSGIGMELSRLLCGEGYSVLGVGRDAESLEDLQKEFGKCFSYITADLSTLGGVKRVVDAVSEKFSRVDVLINNAGFGLYKDVLEHSDEDIVSMTMTNFVTPILLTKKLLPLMHGGSVVVMVITAGIHVLMKNLPIYGATKIALHYSSEALRRELEKRGIHLLAVYPGLVKTNFHIRAGRNVEGGVDAKDVAKVVVKNIKEKKRKRVYIPKYLLLTRILGPHLIPF